MFLWVYITGVLLFKLLGHVATTVAVHRYDVRYFRLGEDAVQLSSKRSIPDISPPPLHSACLDQQTIIIIVTVYAMWTWTFSTFISFLSRSCSTGNYVLFTSHVACTVFQDLIASPPDFSFCSWPNKFAMVIIYFMLWVFVEWERIEIRSGDGRIDIVP